MKVFLMLLQDHITSVSVSTFIYAILADKLEYVVFFTY